MRIRKTTTVASTVALLGATLVTGSAGTIASATTVNWTGGGDASGAWNALTFNGQNYTASDDLIIDGSAAKTITTSGLITSPASLTVSSTTNATTLSGTSIGAAPLGLNGASGTTARIIAGAGATLGTGAITVGLNVQSGAQSSGMTPFLRVNGGSTQTVANNIALSNAGSLTYFALQSGGGAGSTLNLNGNISGGGANTVLQLDTPNSGDGATTFNLNGDNSAFASQIRLNRGRLTLGNANAGGTGSIFLQTNSNPFGNLVFNFTGDFATNITIGTTSGQFISTGANNVNYTGVIGGASTGGSWIKTGTGALTISATQTGLSGSGIAGGTLNLDYSTNNTTKLSDTASLTLSGGTLNLLGGSHPETVGSTTLSAGTTAIARTGSATLVMNGITRGAGSALELGAGGIATTSSALGGANSLATSTLGVLGVVGGDDWIARNATTGLVGYSTVGSYTPTTATTISGNADVASGVLATTLATGGSATTIRFNQNQPTTITNTTGTLSVTQGGILVTPAVSSNTSTISGGTLAPGSNDSLFVFQNNPSGGLAINSVVSDRSQTGNTTYVSGALVKSGAGTLTLGGVNTYSGQTYLNSGATVIAADSGIGGANGTFATLTSLTTSPSVTYTGTLPVGLGIGTSILGSTITAINDSTKTITLAGNAGTALTAGTASWANAQALNINGGTLQTTTTLSMTQTNAGGTAGTTTVNRAVVLGGNGGTFNVASGTTLTVPGVISGVGGLTKSGAGALTLSVANSHAGGTTVIGGKIFLNNASGFGTGALNINSGAVSGVAGSYSSPGAAFVLDLTANTSSMTIANAINFGTVGSATTYGFAMNNLASPGNTTLSGPISGAANITLWLDVNASSTAPAWILSGDNSGFAGTIRLNRSTIQFDKVASFGTGSVFVQTNGSDGSGANRSNVVFNFSGSEKTATIGSALTMRTGSGTTLSIDTKDNNVTLSNIFTSNETNTLSKRGVGDLTLTNAGNLVTDNVTVGDGTLKIGGSGVLNSGGTYSGLLVLSAATSRFEDNSSANQTLSGVISGAGSLTKSGSSTLTLTAANSYTGGTTVSGGTLTVGAGGTLAGTTGALAVNNPNTGAGTAVVLNLATATDTTTGSLSGTIATPSSGTNTATINTQTGRTFTVNQTVAGTYAGAITGTGSLSKAGTSVLTVTGVSTYTGPTSVTAGTLLVGSGGTGSLGDTAITVGDGVNSDTGTLGGSGTIANAGANLVTIAKGGTISPGNSVGRLTTGSETWNGGGAYKWELTNPALGGGADPLAGAGTGWDVIQLDANSLAVASSQSTPFSISIDRSTLAPGSIDPDKWFTVAYSTSPTGLDGITPDQFVLPDVSGISEWESRTLTDANGSYLQVSVAVPEPGSIGLVMAASAAGLLGRRRRCQLLAR